MKSRYNPLLLAVIVIGLVCALWLNVARHDVEQKNNTVEMAMEYEGLRKLAALQGLPEEDVLRQFKDAGINSLMIFDTTLERLTKNGEIQTVTGGELRQAAALGSGMGVFANVGAGDVEENAAYVAATDKQSVLDDVEQDLCLRYGADRVKVVSENPRIIKIKGSTTPLPEGKYDEPQGLLQAPLGLPVQDMRKVAALGFKIIVRPQNYVDVTDEQIDGIFARIKEAGVPVDALMPCGTEVVGYPNKMQHLGERMKENNMTLVMLEHYTQLQFAKIDGLLPLAEFNDYKAARSYVIDPTEQKKISVGEALRRWALTDEERNIRVNYIRPFLMPEGGQDIMKTNLKYVRDIKASVEARGYTIGEAGVFIAENKDGFAQYFPAKVNFIPIVLAIAAGVVRYLALLFNLGGKQQIALWAVFSAGALALLFIGRGLFTRQLLALAAASVFPVDFPSLSVMMILNEDAQSFTSTVHGLADDLFQRSKVPMTKQEVRSVSMSKLQPKATDLIYDIGAGTGSCSIELALLASQGKVWAFERNPVAVELLGKNKALFGVDNLELIAGEALENIKAMPAPDCVFVGGSGGDLCEMLDVIYAKNSDCRVVINAITVETLAEVAAYYKEHPAYSLEIVNVFVARSKHLGSYNLMMAQNPVYVMTALKKED